MAKQVICISRALGAGGEEVARAVSAELGYRYVDDEIISKAAEAAGVSKDKVQEAEHTKGLLARILDSMAGSPGFDATPWGMNSEVPVYLSTSYHGVIQDVIRRTAEGGNVVIVAHAASIPLAGLTGLLRVLVTASPLPRANRYLIAAGVDDRASAKAIQDSDYQREQYLQRFYQVQHEGPLHYDLVINTDVLSPQQAAQVIIAAAQA